MVFTITIFICKKILLFLSNNQISLKTYYSWIYENSPNTHYLSIANA
jgi:hypothetical protein